MTHLIMTLVLLLTAVSTVQARPQVFLTGQELLQHCQGREVHRSRAYLQGVWDALVDLQVDDQPRFCSRQGVLDENLSIVFTSWARRNRSALEHAAANLAAIAFSEAFTCAAEGYPKD